MVGVQSGQAASIRISISRLVRDRFLTVADLTLSHARERDPAFTSAQAVVFTTNHDTTRDATNKPHLLSKNGKLYDLATCSCWWPTGIRR